MTLLRRLRTWPALVMTATVAGMAVPAVVGVTVPAAASTVSPVPSAGNPAAISAGAGCPASMRSWLPRVTAPVPGDPQALAPANLSPQTRIAFGAKAAQLLAGRHIHWVNRTGCPQTHFFNTPPSRGTGSGGTRSGGTGAGGAGAHTDVSSGVEGPAQPSANWSGYQSSDGSFTGASMTWTVPTPDPTVSNGAVSIWPGVGSGDSTSDELVQAGTVTQSDGTIFAWTEVYPKEAEQPISGFPVSGGDSMAVNVSWDPSTQSAGFLVVDYTTGNASMTTESVNGSSGSTAEWIMERPEYCYSGVCVYQPLMKFPNETIGNGAAEQTSAGDTSGGYINSFDYFPYNMTSCQGLNQASPPALAAPSADTDSQGDFTDVWHASGPSGASDDPENCSWAISPSNASFTANLLINDHVVLADSTAHLALTCAGGTLSGTTSNSPQGQVPGTLAQVTGGSFTECTDGRDGDSWSGAPAGGSSWNLDGYTITAGSFTTGSEVTADLTNITIGVTGSVGTNTATCAFHLSGAAPQGDVSYNNGTTQLNITTANLAVSQVSGSGCATVGIKNDDTATLSGIFVTGNVTFIPKTNG